jgi:hypothetical protein
MKTCVVFNIIVKKIKLKHGECRKNINDTLRFLVAWNTIQM